MVNGSIICNTNLLSSEFMWEGKGEQLTLKAQVDLDSAGSYMPLLSLFLSFIPPFVNT